MPVQPRNSSALVRLVLDQSLGLKHPERLTHRESAGTEAFGHILLPDPLTGPDRPAENGVAQIVGDTLAGRP